MRNDLKALTFGKLIGIEVPLIDLEGACLALAEFDTSDNSGAV